MKKKNHILVRLSRIVTFFVFFILLFVIVSVQTRQAKAVSISPPYYCGGSNLCVTQNPLPSVILNSSITPPQNSPIQNPISTSPSTLVPQPDPCITATISHSRERKSRHKNGGQGNISKGLRELLQLLINLLNELLKLFGGGGNTIPNIPDNTITPSNTQLPPPTDPCPSETPNNPLPSTGIPNTNPTAGTNPIVSPSIPIANGFPYPRGTAPAYGFMACSTLSDCKALGATLIHPKYSNSITPQQFVDFVNQAKSLGIQNYFINTMAPEGNSDTFWKAVKDAGITDNDFFGVYFPDEPTSPNEISTMYASMKKYFPNAQAGDYGVENEAASYSKYLDIAYFTTYTKFHDRPSNFPYTNLIQNGPAWKAAGKTLWETTETFGKACTVAASDPDLSTTQKVSDRQIAQIVMGILGGAQGVFPYAGTYAKGTPCETGWSSFKPKYEQLWPWIMKNDRSKLTTTITSGTATAQGSAAVEAYLFKDASGKQLIITSSMLDFTEANNTANNASVAGVQNGTYDVLWENRTVTVSNGIITDTWQPYAYHVYQLK